MALAVRSWVLGVCVMGLMLAAPASLASTPQVIKQNVLVMGDSLSAAYGLRSEQGWVALANATSTRYEFHNASISGETTAGGRSRIAAELKRVSPAIVVIELGANDGLRGLPLRQMGSNLGWMIGASQAAGARVLLVGLQLPPNLGRYASEFQRSYRLISQRLGTGLVPHFLAPLGTDRSLFQSDNLHPVAAAEPALAKLIVDALAQLPPTPH